jgi:ubiquinone/menaquinone biosynthesis C-methylase UbiE
MELMHPNRSKMLEVMLEWLPIGADSSFTALDLGVGTGYFSKAFLDRFPNCRIIAVDGAASMIEMAKARLGPLVARVDFRVGDFRHLDKLLSESECSDVAFSAYALHHLNAAEKLGVVQQVSKFLKPGGWFLNADLIVAQDAAIEKRIQEIRVQGILKRAKGRDPRFSDTASTRTFLDDLEARDNDKPLMLTNDLEILKAAGLKGVSVFWAEYREAVTGGFK